MKRRMRPKKTPRKAGMTTPHVSTQTSSAFPEPGLVVVEFVGVVKVEFVEVVILVSSAPAEESSPWSRISRKKEYFNIMI